MGLRAVRFYSIDNQNVVEQCPADPTKKQEACGCALYNRLINYELPMRVPQTPLPSHSNENRDSRIWGFNNR